MLPISPSCRIGEAIRRKEDARFLTGAGNYTDDVVLPNQAHAVFLRSPHAHAAIKSIDISAAEKMPGVVRIFSGKDIDGKMGGLPCGWLINNPNGTPMKEPPHPILAIGKVRYVGDHVAMVVAETVEQAKNAARRGHRGRLRGAAGAGERGRRGKGQRRLHPRGRPHWPVLQVDAGRQGGGRRGLRQRSARDEAGPRQQPADPQPHRAARGGGRLQPAGDEYTLYVANQNPHIDAAR